MKSKCRGNQGLGSSMRAAQARTAEIGGGSWDAYGGSGRLAPCCFRHADDAGGPGG